MQGVFQLSRIKIRAHALSHAVIQIIRNVARNLQDQNWTTDFSINGFIYINSYSYSFKLAKQKLKIGGDKIWSVNPNKIKENSKRSERIVIIWETDDRENTADRI